MKILSTLNLPSLASCNIEETMKKFAWNEKLENLDGMQSMRANLENIQKFPIIEKVGGKLSGALHIVQTPRGLNICLDITMPCQKSHLLWMPWLPFQSKPQREFGNYIHVNFGKWMVMPRKTLCYGHSYAFSGQTHAVEPTTPDAIQFLYRETNSLFEYQEPGVNMCLVNDYDTGLSKISEHSDDERQFGSIHDVVCWVTGPACRPLELRVKRDKSKKHVPPHLLHLCFDPGNADKTRHLLRISLPEGLYVMAGREFQQFYTHEFPETHAKLFKRIVQAAKEQWSTRSDQQPAKRVRLESPQLTFPTDPITTEKGASLLHLAQAKWLKEHRDSVELLIRNGKVKPSGKFHNPEKDILDFRDWCLERTSYTLRSFVS